MPIYRSITICLHKRYLACLIFETILSKFLKTKNLAIRKLLRTYIIFSKLVHCDSSMILLNLYGILIDSRFIRFLSYMIHPTKFLASVGLAQAHPNHLPWCHQFSINKILKRYLTKINILSNKSHNKSSPNVFKGNLVNSKSFCLHLEKFSKPKILCGISDNLLTLQGIVVWYDWEWDFAQCWLHLGQHWALLCNYTGCVEHWNGVVKWNTGMEYFKLHKVLIIPSSLESIWVSHLIHQLAM